MMKFKVVDTALHCGEDPWDLWGAAAFCAGPGFAGSYHVADSSDRVLNALKNNVPLVTSGDVGRELGPGLYLSAMPQIWVSRAGGKWAFLKGLSPEAMNRLLDALANHHHFQQKNYLTSWEIQSAKDLIDRVRRGFYQDPCALIRLVDQPYNIRFWTPGFLRPLGIEPSPPPRKVLVHFAGKFAKFDNCPYDEILPLHADPELAGAFVPNGFSTMGQLVIWKNAAIIAAYDDGPVTE